MSVEWAKQIASREFGQSEKDAKGKRLYLVQCTSKTDGPDVALGAEDLPVKGEAWGASAPGLIVIDRVASEVRDLGGLLFEVTISYGTEDPNKTETPLKRPIDMKLSFDKSDETAYVAEEVLPAQDADGNAVAGFAWKWKTAVCNSVGQAFDPSIAKYFRDPVITIVRNETTLPMLTAIDFVGAVNDAAFTIKYHGDLYVVQAGQALMDDISTSSKYEDGAYYEEVTYTIRIRKDGWIRKVLDQGTMELNNGDIPARPILDAHGDPVHQSVMLDGKGQKLANGGTPVFLRFRLDKKKDFAELNFHVAPEDPPPAP